MALRTAESRVTGLGRCRGRRALYDDIISPSRWRWKTVAASKCARLLPTSMAHRLLIASRPMFVTETVFWVYAEKASHKCARLSFMMLVEQCAMLGDSSTRYAHARQFTNIKSINQGTMEKIAKTPFPPCKKLNANRLSNLLHCSVLSVFCHTRTAGSFCRYINPTSSTATFSDLIWCSSCRIRVVISLMNLPRISLLYKAHLSPSIVFVAWIFRLARNRVVRNRTVLRSSAERSCSERLFVVKQLACIFAASRLALRRTFWIAERVSAVVCSWSSDMSFEESIASATGLPNSLVS